MTRTGCSAWAGICGVWLAVGLVGGCKQATNEEPVKTQPSERPPTVASRPAPESEPAAEPSRPNEPATRPQATKPASTYSSEPPYPVSLFVQSPDEKQPGWLKIEDFVEDEQLATAQGRFPEQNRIYVDTGNVRRIRIHVGHLPLRPNERVILQIDKQGMVISRKEPFVTLQLSPTGEWVVVKEEKK